MQLKHNFKIFNKDAFERDFQNVNWYHFLEIENKNVNRSLIIS